MRQQKEVVIWPAYFNSRRTRGEGRRVPKSLAIPNPRIREVKEAAEKVSLSNQVILDASYPKMPWLKSGLLLIEKKKPKSQLITKIAKQLVKMHSSTV